MLAALVVLGLAVRLLQHCGVVVLGWSSICSESLVGKRFHAIDDKHRSNDAAE